MKINIRKALPEDAERIMEYLKIVGSETDNLTFGAEGLPVTVENEREFIGSLNESGCSVMLIALDGEEIVSLASVNGNTRERMKHRAEIAISVRKSRWGKGVGSSMMTELIGFAKDAGIEIISLEVRSDNQRAINLYKKFGFEKIGEFGGFFKIDGEYIDFDLMNLYLK